MPEETGVRSHRDLGVWQKSMDMVECVYALTTQFPEPEMYGLTAQLRRSAVSVPSNIAEGAARGSGKDFQRFLHVALGSVAELETQLLIAQRLKFVTEPPMAQLDEVRKMLLGLIRSLGRR